MAIEMEEFDKAHGYLLKALAQNPRNPSAAQLLTEKTPCTYILNQLRYAPAFGTAVASQMLSKVRQRYSKGVWAVSSAGRAPRSQRGGRGFESLTVHQNPSRRHTANNGRLAQWESACFTRKRSLVQSQQRPL